MKDLLPPSRVENAGSTPEAQASLRTLADVPARYLNYPGFESLAVDPAHEDRPIPKTIREAMSAVEAVLSGALKGPVTRSDTAYIDFYDGDGYPFDVKTPLSPSGKDKWEFDSAGNAETILSQLDKTHKMKGSSQEAPVAVLLDTTYLSAEDHHALWHELRRKTKEDRGILKRIYEVNVETGHRAAQLSVAVNAALIRKNRGR